MVKIRLNSPKTFSNLLAQLPIEHFSYHIFVYSFQFQNLGMGVEQRNSAWIISQKMWNNPMKIHK